MCLRNYCELSISCELSRSLGPLKSLNSLPLGCGPVQVEIKWLYIHCLSPIKKVKSSIPDWLKLVQSVFDDLETFLIGALAFLSAWASATFILVSGTFLRAKMFWKHMLHREALDRESGPQPDCSLLISAFEWIISDVPGWYSLDVCDDPSSPIKTARSGATS